MQHELQPDSLVDLKFIMADTGFGKTFIYDRIKSKIFLTSKKHHSNQSPAASSRCLQGTP